MDATIEMENGLLKMLREMEKNQSDGSGKQRIYSSLSMNWKR